MRFPFYSAKTQMIGVDFKEAQLPFLAESKDFPVRKRNYQI
jgi:hypothetical protein